MKLRGRAGDAARGLRRRSARLPHSLRSPDAAAVALILLLTAVAARPLLVGGTILGLDAATQFYPWYSFLGESLRSGQIPGWNPNQFSGVPFAGDPLSGWTYLPAMLLFTLLPLAAAAKSFMFFHLLLAGVSMYALGRALRLGVPGALVAAVAFEFSGLMYFRNVCCFAYSSVSAWLPLTLLGAELAIRSRILTSKLLWSGLAGLALSQILASWPGQGSYYALLALGGYVAYRSLLFPPEEVRGARGRLWALTLTGGAILLVGLGLAAAGLLPRLEFNALSSISEAYAADDEVRGWTIRDWKELYQRHTIFYAGGAVLALALSAPLISRTAHAVPYSAALALVALTLAGEGTTPLHSLMYLLPKFEMVHTHSPQRVMILFYPAAALLAGAAVTGLARRCRARPALAALPALAGLFLVTRSTLVPPVDAPEQRGFWEAPTVFLKENGVLIPPGPLITLTLAVCLAAAYGLLPARRSALRELAALALVLAVFAELFAVDNVTIDAHSNYSGQGELDKVDLAEHYAPTGATRFLQSREEPFRYFGYDNRKRPYNRQFTDPAVNALEVNTRATLWGLQSVQGYSAVHLQRYDRYLEALNGEPQPYHSAFVREDGLGSPLLDLLNVRYFIAPANPGPGAPKKLRSLERDYPTAYEGERVRVLENPEALPRAWIVHSAQRAGPQETLDLLSSEEVDPRETALVEDEPPPLRDPDDASEDEARVTAYEPNRIEVSASTGARGLLVLSEVYYPGWNAYVDGEKAVTRRANHLLRAVPLPAGEHTVELRYEPWTLRAGIAISTLTAAAVLGVAAAALIRRRSSTGEEDT